MLVAYWTQFIELTAALLRYSFGNCVNIELWQLLY
jgi:hypothetical protein